MENNKGNTPLWKELNSKITKGPIGYNETYVGAGIFQIADCFNHHLPKEDVAANTQYIALSVANLASLAEALQNVSDAIEHAINATPTGVTRNLLCDANIIAKEALQRIS